MRKITLFFVLIALSIYGYSQTCPSQNPYEWPTHSNWFFGNGNMLTFPGGTGAPTVKNILPTNWVSPAIRSYEGITTISDDNGDLLYFCNGRLLWDNTYTNIATGFLTGNENGNSPGSPGGSTGSAVQGVMSVRHPLNPTQVYIFTTDDALSNTLGFNYWILDTQTGSVSGPNRLGNFRSTEQVDATWHSNGVDVWILTRRSSKNSSKDEFRKFNAYLLTCEGLVETPVVSTAGPVVDAASGHSNWDRGGLKFSWDSKRVAAVNHLTAWDDYDDAYTVYDFDNATGKLSNVRSFSGNKGQYSFNGPTYPDGYDVEFTLDNNAVVIATVNGGLKWANINSNSGATIYGTLKDIPGGKGACALQFGGDGKLYANTLSNKLDQINGNLSTGTGITVSSITTPNNAQRGLPNMFLPPALEPDIQEVGPFCDDADAVDLNTVWMCTGKNAEDPNGTPPSMYSGKGIIDSGKGIFDPKVAGEGLHEIIFTKCSVDDTIWIKVTVCEDCKDTTLSSIKPICAGTGSVDLSSHQITTAPGTWSVVSTPTGGSPTVLSGSTFDATNAIAGNYRVRFTLDGTPFTGCPDSSERTIVVLPKPIVNLGPDQSICPGDSFLFDAGIGFSSYLWSGLGSGTTSIFNAKIAGEYIVEVTDVAGCIGRDTANITYLSNPTVNLGPDTNICPGQKVTLDAGSFTSYNWYIDGSGISQTFVANNSGNYAVEVTDANGCKGSDTIIISLKEKPIVDLGPDQIVCPGEDVTFDAGVFTTYKWYGSISTTDRSIKVNQASTFIVEVEDQNGCKDSDTVALAIHNKPIVDLGLDTSICPGDSVLFDAGTFAAYSWSSAGVGTTQTYLGKNSGLYVVEVTDVNGCKDTDSVTINFYSIPDVDLGPDQTVCPGDSFTFDAGTFASYKWSEDASGTNQKYTAFKEGLYSVVVTDDNGCSDSDAVILNNYTKPIVDLGPDRSICENGPIQTFDAGNFVSYEWGISASGTNQTYSTNDSGLFQVVVTDVNSCKDTDSVVLNINPLPTPNVITDVSICPGMTQTFDVTVYTNGNGPYTYSWNDGTTNSSINATNAGWYWVDVEDKNGCIGRDSAELSIKANLSVSIFGAPQIDLCEGIDTVLKTNYNAVDGYNFSWTGDATSSSEVITTSNTVGNYTYNVNVNNGQGCEGDATINVIVHPNPTPLPVDTHFCEGSSVTVSLNMGASYNYLWSTGETTSSINVNSTNLSSPYQVKVIDAVTGCSGQTNVTVSQINNPVVKIDDVTVCEGVPVSLSSSISYTNVSYLWNLGETTEVINPTTTGIYSLEVKNAQGCTGSDDATVTFIPIPVVDLGPDTVTICEGESYVFDAGNNGLDILWNTGAKTSQISVSNQNMYSVTISEGGCSATDQVQLMVVQLPTSELDKTLEANKYCFEEEERGVLLVANSNNPYTYEWNTGDNTNSIFAKQAGNYSVKISAGSCSVVDDINITEYCPWSLFVPNAITPNGDGINEVFNAKAHNIIDYKMYVFNRWGEEIFETNSLSEGWDGRVNNRDVQIDVYVYKIVFSFNDEKGVKMWDEKVGTVTVIR